MSQVRPQVSGGPGRTGRRTPHWPARRHPRRGHRHRFGSRDAFLLHLHQRYYTALYAQLDDVLENRPDDLAAAIGDTWHSLADSRRAMRPPAGRARRPARACHGRGFAGGGSSATSASTYRPSLPSAGRRPSIQRFRMRWFDRHTWRPQPQLRGCARPVGTGNGDRETVPIQSPRRSERTNSHHR